MSFYVYLARCTDDSLYCGYCKNINQREASHNAGTGAKYTRNRGPVKMVYTEAHPTKSQAMKREYALKQLSKTQKESLISGADADGDATERI